MLLDLLAAGSVAVDDRAARGKAATGLCKRLVRRLERWHRAVAADVGRFEQLDSDARHRLRKRLKRLRYGVEFAAALFEKRALRRYLRRLHAAQQRLGELNDLVMATRVFERARFADPRARVALGWLAARHDALVGEAQPELRAFASVKRCWDRD
jgi:CHAD domain-containing protein